jgi:hypothetical protein
VENDPAGARTGGPSRLSRLTYTADRAVRARIARSPFLFPYMARGRGGWLATPESDIVIDGFPRSANTFSVHAFRLANPDATIAHHTHAPAQVLRAVRLGLPTIVLLRRPRGAVISEVIREPRRTIPRALRDWLSFYDTVCPVVGAFVLGEFEAVTSDYGPVIESVNERFGTAFTPFRNDPERDGVTFDSIDRVNRAKGKSGMQLELQVPRPSEVRRSLQADLEAELERPASRRLLARADERYEWLVRAASSS